MMLDVGTKNKPPIGTLRAIREDGSSFTIDILAPGSAVRLSIGTPDAHGMVWRLWTSPNTPDLYLSVRDEFNGGDSKYSFHASGDWRLQYEYARAQALGVNRVLDKWERPAPNASGAIVVARIMLPSDDIVATGKPVADAGKITWIAPGAPHALNVLVVLLVPAGAQFAPPSDAPPVAAMTMSDGSFVVVVHAIGPVTPVEEDMFDKVRQQASLNPPPGTSAEYIPRSDPNYRCEGFLRSVDGDDLVIADLLM
jgi:hypothetical protein